MDKKNKNVDTEIILEQYKIYVESASEISQRRASTNAFFIGVNSFLVTGISILFEKEIVVGSLTLIAILALQLSIVLIWVLLIRSYRQLNSAKYKVIGEIENLLPISPFWKMEWKELGEGKSYKKYIPLTVIERYIPFLFLALYLVIFLAVVLQIS